MYAFLKGEITECSPTHVVLQVHGVGYFLSISLHTYEKVSSLRETLLYTYLWVKEDALSLFGFADKEEKAIFEMLITVSGVGPNTARTVLSTLSPAEVAGAISKANVPLLQSVKGIGAKTAQRMVLELQDKVMKTASGPVHGIVGQDHQQREEALAALVMLGFNRTAAEKALAQVLKTNPSTDLTVEQLIKLTLKAI
ncbi:MAG: Holliday junction branch migration protein RuvA [Bacteroidetes bacterium]|jgi:Holliday junction DNA helicase RuvA|nr:Holliday junction branch migration protein RuvA [Bacteroidota bacterium]